MSGDEWCCEEVFDADDVEEEECDELPPSLVDAHLVVAHSFMAAVDALHEAQEAARLEALLAGSVAEIEAQFSLHSSCDGAMAAAAAASAQQRERDQAKLREALAADTAELRAAEYELRAARAAELSQRAAAEELAGESAKAAPGTIVEEDTETDDITAWLQSDDVKMMVEKPFVWQPSEADKEAAASLRDLLADGDAELQRAIAARTMQASKSKRRIIGGVVRPPSAGAARVEEAPAAVAHADVRPSSKGSARVLRSSASASALSLDLGGGGSVLASDASAPLLNQAFVNQPPLWRSSSAGSLGFAAGNNNGKAFLPSISTGTGMAYSAKAGAQFGRPDSAASAWSNGSTLRSRRPLGTVGGAIAGGSGRRAFDLATF
eukprot:TRINITY_DN28893_c0_g1_i1.p1 TRINITY_DN28893_c0_g1~~TRINITY_DN28893_c0_g1_i1.p1  ORF type:complete len:405 (-),score=122.15 TRINITY_DN28893_c0_g1_i1:148-1284(-)